MELLDANIALFVAASLAVIVAPGPDNIYVLTGTSERVSRPSWRNADPSGRAGNFRTRGEGSSALQESFFGAIDSRRPEIAEDAFVAPATVVVGRVRESDTAMVGHAFESYVCKSGVHREVEPLSLQEVLPR